MIDDVLWNINTRHGFSCRWHLRQGTTLRDWKNVINSSKGGIEIWSKVSKETDYIIGVYDTRRINRKLRKFIMEN